jgi:putative membrane protein
MKIKRHSLAACLILLISAAAFTSCNRNRGVEAARDNRPASVSPAEQDFMAKAAQANVAEIDMARLALQKSQNSDVKDYAKMIEKDHNNALQELTDLMKDKNVQLPNAVPTEAQQDLSKMNGLTGGDFDREFANKMVSDHQQAIQLFRDEQASAQDPDLKKYIDNVLPKLEKHLDEAQRLQSKLFNEQPANTSTKG